MGFGTRPDGIRDIFPRSHSPRPPFPNGLQKRVHGLVPVLLSTTPQGILCSRSLLLAALLIGLVGGLRRTAAQAPLRYVNDNTTVREISFRFADDQTFDTSRLRKQIATEAPGTLTEIRNWVAFLPLVQRHLFFFDPVTLQKDVARLRQFYQQHGFPNPEIDYPASQLDTSRNRIHVIFTIREGRSRKIRDTEFLNAEGTAPITTVLEGEVQTAWTTYRTEEIEIGGRYTEFAKTQLADRIQTWFRNRGFAFAQVESTASVDTSQYAVDLRFRIDPGPRGVVSEIRVEGNESVDRSTILRELPFSVGDRFSAEKVTRGQQMLFDLNLFRVALADVPVQPHDSTVVVHYRVREAALRSFSGLTGYSTRSGVTLEGGWRHRNFYGNARTFSVNLTAETGYPENPPSFVPGFLSRASSQEVSRQFRVSATLRQPYLFTTRLSGTLAPFAQERLNPALSPNPDRFLSLNERQYGINTTLIYDLLPYRTVSLQHSVARTQQYLTTATEDTIPSDPSLISEEDLFNKSVFTLNGTFGKANDFISPTRGFIVRPSVQLGGFFFESGVEFAQLSTELSGYLPVSESLELAGRVTLGTMWPFDESRTNLTLPASPTDRERRLNRIYQNRFSDYLFFAGSGSDVRGWASQLAGGKVLRESPVLREGYAYRPIGGRTKISASLEVRIPLPGLGSKWRIGTFVDGAYLTPDPLRLTPPATVPTVVTNPQGNPVSTDPSQLLVGTGAGIRYQTGFGFLRIDLGYKLTPDPLDLRNAEQVGNALTGEAPVPVSQVETRFLRRFRLHFGIGRSF